MPQVPFIICRPLYNKSFSNRLSFIRNIAFQVSVFFNPFHTDHVFSREMENVVCLSKFAYFYKNCQILNEVSEFELQITCK